MKRLVGGLILVGVLALPALLFGQDTTTRTSASFCPKTSLNIGEKFTAVKGPPGAVCLKKDGATPAPIPTPLPPTSASSEPVFDPTWFVVHQDNMDAYVSGDQMWAAHLLTTGGPPHMAQPDGPRNSLQVIAPGRGGNGKALRVAFPGCSQCGDAWKTRGLPVETPPLATNYIQYWARVNFSAPLTTTLGVKWLEAWHSSGSDRVQWQMHWGTGACNMPNHTAWQVLDQSRLTTCQAAQPIGPYIQNVADNQWHRFTYEYRSNSRAGARDGVARMWVDGIKIIDVSQSAVGATPPGGTKPWCNQDDVDKLAVADGIFTLHLGDVQTTPTPAWTLDIDDLIWRRTVR